MRDALKGIFNKSRLPKKLQTNKGKEFRNEAVQSQLRKLKMSYFLMDRNYKSQRHPCSMNTQQLNEFMFRRVPPKAKDYFVRKYSSSNLPVIKKKPRCKIEFTRSALVLHLHRRQWKRQGI